MPNGDSLRTSFSFPHLLSNALVVYRIIPRLYGDLVGIGMLYLFRIASRPSTFAFVPSDHHVPPLIMHTPHATETHYFPLLGQQDRRILLHTHLPAPFIPQHVRLLKGLHFTIYSSQKSSDILIGLDITIDWSATFGQWASRYLNTIASWAAGVSALILFNAIGHSDNGGEYFFL